MLKGEVFAEQLFENQIFALFINTFLNGKDGVSTDYGSGMPITYSGSNVTIGDGAVCIQGRFLREETSTTINAGTNNLYCSLVIEIDLDKTNTAQNFLQGVYKILKSSGSYPSLTKTNIVKNNAGVYQYELARFRNGSNGITNFEDRRTFLDFESIYTEIENTLNTNMTTFQTNANSLINSLRSEIAGVEDSSEFIMKSTIKTIEKNVTPTLIDGKYYASASVDLPSGYTANNTVILRAESVLDTGVAGNFSTTFSPVYSYMDDDNVTYLNINSIEVEQLTYKFRLIIMRV